LIKIPLKNILGSIADAEWRICHLFTLKLCA